MVSVAVSLLGSWSATSAGGEIVAVLTRMPLAAASIVADTRNVTDPPAGRFTVESIEPLPVATHEPPADPVQTHVAPVSAADSVSCTIAPVASNGPALAATIV